MKKLICIISAFLLVNCSNSKKEIITAPGWQKGDLRHIKTNMMGFVKVKDDTLANLHDENTYSFKVVDVSKDFYTVELKNISKSETDYTFNIDTIEDEHNKMITFLHSFKKIPVSFKLKLSKSGSIIEIVDWELVLDKFITRFIKMADSLNLPKQDQEYVEQFYPTSFVSEAYLREALISELSEYLDFYNKKLPTDDSIATEKHDFYDPFTNRIIDAKLIYEISSIKNGIYTVKGRDEFDEDDLINHDDYLDNFFNDNEAKTKLSMRLERYLTFYWNSNTSWIDSTFIYSSQIRDTFESREEINAIVIK